MIQVLSRAFICSGLYRRQLFKPILAAHSKFLRGFIMKVILTKDHHELGVNGSLVEVAEGYARNYLIPNSLAVNATKNVMAHYEDRKKARANKEAAIRERAREQAAKIGELSLTVDVKVGEEGRLYGTVTTKEIAALLAEQHQIELDKKQIEIPHAIKNVGDHLVKIKLHPEVSTELRLTVQAEA
ncbi:MAG: 50S ribosomal protein L9 [Candidatus Melainabacteria bacterium HGW-Melainabacteria-1]|nr:MAG: 50S ribosomal protein L9 [Candidatus Melainabacteria bacterium HGW-Melainabacteria-1]